MLLDVSSNMADKKVMAITAVLILVIAAGAAFIVMNGGDDDGYKVDETGRLMILGNADNNDLVDKNDVDTLETIINSGSWDQEKYPYADANNDGKITQADVDTVEKILDKTVGHVYYVNKDGDIMPSNYPVDKFVSVGTFAINHMIVLGEDKCVGISKSSNFIDNTYWTGITNKAKISDNAKRADYELVTAIDGVKAIFSGDSAGGGIPNESDFVKADIDVVRLDFNGPNETAAVMIMGFLIDEVDRSLEIVEYYDKVAAKTEEVIAKHPELSKQTALVSYNNLTMQSNIGAQGYFPEKLGMSNAWIYDAKIDDKETLSAKTGDSEWYLNDRFRCDYIIELSNMNYDADASADSYLSQLNEYFHKLDAFPTKTVLINSSVPLFAKMAYLLEGLFPEDVGVGYADKIFQSYLEEFNPAFTATGYDVSEDGLFLVTPEEIKAYAEAHKI